MKNRNSIHNQGFTLLMNVALIFLTIHLFIVNSVLLVHLSPDKISAQHTLNFSKLEVDDVIAMINSIIYSVITAIILITINGSKSGIMIFSWFALLDGMADYVNYSGIQSFHLIGGIYFSIFTASIVIALGYIQIFYVRVSKERKMPDESISTLRQKLYKRRRTLKYNGLSVENDKIIIDLQTKIKKLTDR